MSQSIEYIHSSAGDAGEILARYLTQEIDRKQNVVWFISGGSSIPVAQKAIRFIGTRRLEKIKIVVVDEKFKSVSQVVTNWSQLVEGNAYLRQAVKPILHADRIAVGSLELYREHIKECLEWADCTIGQFGIGEGYHTGGIQSSSIAVTDKSLAAYYQCGDFQHITVTTGLISQLDLVFVNSFGEAKRELVEHFAESVATIQKEPTQALKLANQVVVATDAIS